MWHTILDLFTYPGKTIDRLLAEKNYVKSNAVFYLTMILASLSPIISIYLLPKISVDIRPWLITFLAIGSIGGLLFARFLFRMLVQLGLMLTSNQDIPKDPVERKNRARELYLLYPYHVIPLIIPAIILPLIVAPTGNDSIHLLLKLILMIGYVLLSWGAFAFQIVIMVIIVKSIYHVSTAKAFWSPILAYFLLSIFLTILGITVALIIAFTTSLLN